MRHRLKRPTAESRSPHGRRRRFDEVQTMEKLNFKLFKLRLNGSDHLFLSDFRWPTSARSDGQGDGRALRAVMRSVVVTVRKTRPPNPFPAMP